MAVARRRGGAAAGAVALSDATIVALSSGAPPAAIGIIRISGPRAFATAEALAGRLPPPRHAALRGLRNDAGELLDRALVLAFPAAASATGEDLVELHCHGGRAVLMAVEAAILRCTGVRAAEAGEFTRRAMLNGRIDLTQAQGLADLLAAETESERRLAIRGAEGEGRRVIGEWMDRLTTAAAALEASIDFGEEGDVVAEAASLASVDAMLDALADEMAAVANAPPVERWKEGWRVVLAGPPNAGKSTLLNSLAGRDAAIVSPLAGTTRDVIEVTVRRDGIGFVLIDTAGRRDDSVDPIERQGIERAFAAAAAADVLLWLDDCPPPPTMAAVIWVHAKADQPDRRGGPGQVAVSRKDGASIERLWAAIVAACGADCAPPLPLHRRDHEVVTDAARRLKGRASDIVLIAEVVRELRRDLGALLGIDATEALYDRVFREFCIGK